AVSLRLEREDRMGNGSQNILRPHGSRGSFCAVRGGVVVSPQIAGWCARSFSCCAPRGGAGTLAQRACRHCLAASVEQTGAVPACRLRGFLDRVAAAAV